MTPSRKANKYFQPEAKNMGGTIKSNSSSSCYNQSHSYNNNSQNNSTTAESQARSTQGSVMSSSDEKYPHHSHSHQNNSSTNQRTFRKQSKINSNDSEFIPVFSLVEAARENSERKVREICWKLKMLDAEEAAPVVNFQDQTGRTALSYGCGCGNIRVIDEISRMKCADPNVPDNDGNAPLHYSSVCGHAEGVDLLLTRFHGVIDVNARNASGITPLMKAAIQGRTRCAKSLLAAGASPYLKDHIRGLSAADWARLCGRQMCAEIINRNSYAGEELSVASSKGSTLVYSRTLPNLQVPDERSRNHSAAEDASYTHLYARSTVNGAKWLKNKIKKALSGSRSGEDKSYVCDNPIVRSLADRRPTLPPDRNFSALSNLGMGGAICASSLLFPEIKPMVVDKQRQQRPRKLTIPSVQITPVRR